MSCFGYVLNEHFLLPNPPVNSVILHSFNNHLLSTYYVLDIVLDTRDTITNNEGDMAPALMRLTVEWEIYAKNLLQHIVMSVKMGCKDVPSDG